jgi:spore coat polysaccharide biosynthesis protein SpsF
MTLRIDRRLVGSGVICDATVCCGKQNLEPLTMGESHQIKFWKGSFGDAYVDRNEASARLIAAAVHLWSDILKHTIGAPPRSILEVGCNIGLNLRALKTMTSAELFAIEPNDKARCVLLRDGVLAASNLRDGAAQDIDFPDNVADLAFTSGVLIHIHPDELLAACKEIDRCARRYIACIEYFSDQPETIPYRGHDDVLFKRDFGSFWLDNFPRLRTLAYGFHWKRGAAVDNTNWWLFEKSY